MLRSLRQVAERKIKQTNRVSGIVVSYPQCSFSSTVSQSQPTDMIVRPFPSELFEKWNRAVELVRADRFDRVRYVHRCLR